MTGDAILVVGLAREPDGQAREVVRETLRHGSAPRRQLHDAGFRAEALPEVSRDDAGVVLTYGVTALSSATHRPSASRRAVQVDVVRQRLAAYAVVTSSRGVLLTELSQTTGRPGLWILPGGGIDAGEDPVDTVTREVWEETGQQVEVAQLVDVSSSHRVGPGRCGLVEDFHAVRLLFTAHCADPDDPVVHDIGGSTATASWFRLGDVVAPSSSGYPDGGMAPWALDAVRAFTASP